MKVIKYIIRVSSILIALVGLIYVGYEFVGMISNMNYKQFVDYIVPFILFVGCVLAVILIGWAWDD